MIVYVVQRSGVYAQGIGGVFTSKKAAEEAIRQLKEKEPDNYHEFAIYEINTDEVLDPNETR